MKKIEMTSFDLRNMDSGQIRAPILIISLCFSLFLVGISTLEKHWIGDWSLWEGRSSTLDYLQAWCGALERHDDLRLETDFYACLPLCSFAHTCEGRSSQAGTPEIAIATHARLCGIGRRNGMPWGRLIPRVGMLTITGPLGTAQAGLPTGRSYKIGTLVT
uniref:Uncharacterized protein n=1 Tax=Ananas comosus var. bracteatus TaxID=296719 RepID=A0A6V7NWG5_ANACO|nr:unnamed protein product [Ananas comosus var. bracteatus]